MRFLLAITGASGAIIGIKLLQELKSRGTEVLLIISRWGEQVIAAETPLTPEQVKKMADASYEPEDMTAPVASGSFHHDGMVIAPCSMKTLAGIANGYSGSLVERAADVALKERRHLLLVPRETPLSPIHLQNMLEATRAGAIVMPFMPAFYTQPATLEDALNYFIRHLIVHLRL